MSETLRYHVSRNFFQDGLTMKRPAFLFCVFALFQGPLAFADAADGTAGHVKSVEGSVWIVRGTSRTAAQLGTQVREHDVIETDANGKAGITFNDNTQVSLGPKSHFTVEGYKYDANTTKGNFLAKLKRGTLFVASGDITRNTPGAMQVQTPRAVAAVRGTHFLVKVPETE
jgi:hypothetical protein